MSEDCRHHWRIEMANGPYSEGVCELCGEQRLFKNSAVLSKDELKQVGLNVR